LDRPGEAKDNLGGRSGVESGETRGGADGRRGRAKLFGEKMPRNILDDILATKRREVAELRQRFGEGELPAAAAAAPPARNFFSAVTRRPRRLVNLIAEVKKASPSAGVIREDFDPPRIAAEYALAGASAISVLTDRDYFQGSLDYLRAVRAAVELPVLRKDFIIDPLQVYEARAAGADAILLIAAALPPGELLDLMILSAELRMTSLVEVHDADEILQVRSAIGFPHRSYSLLGINNRNLATFEVDVRTTTRLAELAGDGTPVVSESGIKTIDDVRMLRRAGVNAILVGETLMRSGDVARAVEELIGPEEG
jgi:indole-3-glycerol phosphate synthase